MAPCLPWSPFPFVPRLRLMNAYLDVGCTSPYPFFPMLGHSVWPPVQFQDSKDVYFACIAVQSLASDTYRRVARAKRQGSARKGRGLVMLVLVV